ncbi:BppU family phage baseplate upper protein [Enterococcus dispar]|uniref:BppU family phage baseplate upper protein n=1 Tax=Enterococcus dispar TaxID=44009 RepID=UPI0021D422F2|nr:BppU family phage baseplate upper protein [Enterococcus dispar]MCU7356705.1 BppU family phage baseplate upper protein [Enterococcus dispar]
MANEKKAVWKIDVSAKKKPVRKSNVQYFSYDDQTAVIAIEPFSGSNAIDVSTISKAMIAIESVNQVGVPNEKVIFEDTISLVGGKIEYTIPKSVLTYQGYLAFEIYLDYKDSKKSDSSERIIFENRLSMIDRNAGQAELVYIKDMETAKQEIAQKASEIKTEMDEYQTGLDDYRNEKMAEMDAYSADVKTASEQSIEDINGEYGRVSSTANEEITKIKSVLPDVEAEVSTVKTELNSLKDNMQLSEAWSNSPDGTVDFSRTKPRSTATPWTSAPSDSTLENEFSKYYGLALTDSNDPADYIWVESPEYTRYKAQINSEDLMLSWHTGQQITKRHLIDFKGKVPGSTVENCNIVKYSTALTPSNTSGLEVIQTNYSNIATLDGNAWRIAIADDQKRINAIFSFNLVEQVNRDYPSLYESVGADTLAKQIAFLRKVTTRMIPSVWGYGSSPTGNLLSMKVWNTTSWSTSSATNTTNAVKELSFIWGSSTATTFLQADGYIYILAYANPSDGTTASIVSIDYASLEYTLSFKKSDFEIITRDEIADIKNRLAQL